MGKIVYSRASTHIGNSLIVYYSGGQASSMPVYGSIEYIFTINDELKFAARPYQAAAVTFDPFALYPHFPAKLNSTSKAGLEIVHVDWVLGHFARWAYTSELVVVLPLLRI